MTLDEAIKHAEEAAEENQRVVDTGIVFDGITIDMLFCDDTEVIEEHLANYQRCAEEHRQLAEWLKDYKRLLEQVPCEDAIRRQAVLEYIEGSGAELGHSTENELVCQHIKELPSVTPQPKTAHWIKVQGRPHHARCGTCGRVTAYARGMRYCPFCGAKDG